MAENNLVMYGALILAIVFGIVAVFFYKEASSANNKLSQIKKEQKKNQKRKIIENGSDQAELGPYVSRGKWLLSYIQKDFDKFKSPEKVLDILEIGQECDLNLPEAITTAHLKYVGDIILQIHGIETYADLLAFKYSPRFDLTYSEIDEQGTQHFHVSENRVRGQYKEKLDILARKEGIDRKKETRVEQNKPKTKAVEVPIKITKTNGANKAQKVVQSPNEKPNTSGKKDKIEPSMSPQKEK